MTTNDHLVVLIDDCWRIREAVGDLLLSLGFETRAFGCIADYLEYARPSVPSCLVLDVHLPDMSGLEFQARNARNARNQDSPHPPIVFITGDGDIPSSVSAMKRGAVDYLTKPLREDELVRAVQTAIEQDRTTAAARAELASLQTRYATLSPRERDVMPLIVAGRLNKQAAADLGISEVTLQIHRRRIMQKMQAASLADLVRMAVALGS